MGSLYGPCLISGLLTPQHHPLRHISNVSRSLLNGNGIRIRIGFSIGIRPFHIRSRIAKEPANILVDC